MESKNVQRIAVIGAGQMGRGIAQTCAQNGHEVLLCDLDIARASAGKSEIEQQLQRLLGKAKITAEQSAATLARLVPSEVEPGASTAHLVIEAASEDPDLKLRLFEKLDAVAPSQTILCSNTSSISITRLAGATNRPERVVGMHFMNPVPVMKLVELIRGQATSDETHGLVSEFAEGLGKTVVTSADRPGFIVNRVLIPMLNEACFALSEGVASIEDTDLAITLGLNHPMGPFRLADWIGLDTVLAIASVLHDDFGDSKYRPCVLLRNLVAAGHLGVKSGRGFYIYEGSGPVRSAF
jgi:3-hydroxybutyryl-CoA dehydrogenase